MSTLYVDNLEPNLGSRVMAAGHVVQVVQYVHSTEVSKTGTAVTATGVKASITPTSTSSKILITYDMQWHIDTSPSSGGVGFRIHKDGTFLVGDDTGYRSGYAQLSGSGDRPRGRSSFTYLDSPSTTSSILYEIYWMAWDQATSRICEGNVPSSITLMEIAG